MKCLTRREVGLLLGACAAVVRERAIFGVALGTGLRCHELLALDVGDVLHANGAPRAIVDLRTFKRTGHRSAQVAPQVAFLSPAVGLLVGALCAHKARRGEPLEPSAPLFLSRHRRRLSTREARYLFRRWQQRAGFERIFGFHALRHTACTNVYRATKDIRVTQRFARHASILSTAIYTHPSEDDLLDAVALIPC